MNLLLSLAESNIFECNLDGFIDYFLLDYNQENKDYSFLLIYQCYVEKKKLIKFTRFTISLVDEEYF